MWVELLLALIAEGYREFMEWWQSRAVFRPRGAAAPSEESDAHAVPAAARGVRGVARARFVEETVGGTLARHARKHVGVAVGVWWQGESWTFARGRIGLERPIPPDADTIFEIGSVTKVFTATVLADMVEEGVVALDDPVQLHLPKAVELPVRGRPMTLEDLATQTSGLPRQRPGFVRRSLAHRDDPYAGFNELDLERAVAHVELKGSPGEKLRYSNLGFGLLGYLLARRAERSFEQLVRERVCDALGLRDTWISIPDEKRQRFADGHNRRGRPVAHWDLGALVGAGGLRSTVADLLRFLAVQHDPPNTRLVRAVRATHVARAQRGKLAQCLGWVRLPLRRDSSEVLWHNGGTGGFRSFVGFVGERRVGVVVLTNSSRSVDAIGFRLLEAISRA